MTLDEACAYLGVSPDDEDLDIDQIEKNYNTKKSIYDLKRFNPDTPEYREAKRMGANIEEAYEFLLDVYVELYGDGEEIPAEPESSGHEALFMKLAVLMAGVFLLFFGGVVYFVYRLHTGSITPPKNEAVYSAEDYEKMKREIEQLKIIAEEAAHTQNNNNADYAELVEKVMPAMLFIQTDIGTGSGFFVSPNGDILTNYHVIRDAAYITAITHDGESMNALVKDYDAKRDMALLKIALPDRITYLKISNELPRQGEAVIAIGNPRGLSGSVSNGIVSAFREIDNNMYVQFTAPVSHGSSGGALINLRGEVIGMPAMIRTDGQNLNFAIHPAVLSTFLTSAINKPARVLPTRQNTDSNKAQSTSGTPRTKFVRKDEGYEIYLVTDSIDYDRQRHIASFITLWYPTEKSKTIMLKDPHFHVPYGEELGLCVLLYVVNLNDNTYLHLRTINYCTSGYIARDYIKPQYEWKWDKPAKRSRIESLMKEVKRQLRIR